MPIAVTMDDKYMLESRTVYLTGTQAWCGWTMIARQRDLDAGLNTAAISPAIGLAVRRASTQGAVAGQSASSEEPHRVQPGVTSTEGLAATPCGANQQIHLYPGAATGGSACGTARRPGPSDRSGDVLMKPANYAAPPGTAASCGPCGALTGQVVDERPTRASPPSWPPASRCSIPPALFEEYLDFGCSLRMSRYSGLWVRLQAC